MGKSAHTTLGDLTGFGTFNKKFTPTSTQMRSKSEPESHFYDVILNVNVLMFAFLAIMFFNLGRTYANIKSKMEERKNRRTPANVFSANNAYKKNDDIDEERQKINDDSDYLRTVRAELEESRQEVRQLSEELRRLR